MASIPSSTNGRFSCVVNQCRVGLGAFSFALWRTTLCQPKQVSHGTTAVGNEWSVLRREKLARSLTNHRENKRLCECTDSPVKKICCEPKFISEQIAQNQIDWSHSKTKSLLALSPIIGKTRGSVNVRTRPGRKFVASNKAVQVRRISSTISVVAPYQQNYQS